MKKLKQKLVIATMAATTIATTAAISAQTTDATVSVKAMADALHLVRRTSNSLLFE